MTVHALHNEGTEICCINVFAIVKEMYYVVNISSKFSMDKSITSLQEQDVFKKLYCTANFQLNGSRIVGLDRNKKLI